MAGTPPNDPAGDVLWTEDGTPASRRYGDVYFSPDGLAESRAVFLAGCGLPEAWAGRRSFVVAELGFGTGLNVLALLELWARTRLPGARLHVFSVEAHPLPPGDAARALAAFPELAGLAAPLLAQWPAVVTGRARIDLPELDAVIDVAVAEAGEALAQWRGSADAWFLDGFAPARNPEIWRDEVLDLVAARSAPGARAASFSVAGAVRRGLAARGFEVTRAPGHGRKRQRLEARRPGVPVEPSRPPRVAVVGGGVAGASLARAFRALGADPVLIDPAPGGGASGAPAALVSPRLDVSGGPAAQLYAQAFLRSVALYERTAPEAIVARGALRLAASNRDEARFEALAASPLFPAGALLRLTAGEAAERLGEAEAGPALWIPDALTVAPERLIAAWSGPGVLHAAVARLERGGDAWRLTDGDGALLAEAEVVCLAAGAAMDALAGTALIEPVRGQATWSAPLAQPPPAASWGGYAVPTAAGGVLFGATHQRGDGDATARAEDDDRNLAALAARRPRLAEAVRQTALSGRASIRAATRDRLPLAGLLAPGLFLLGGLGGRGFTTAPLLAEHVAAEALGFPSPLPLALHELVSAGRFRRREAARKVGPPEDSP